MSKKEAEPQAAIPYGWCMTADHDTHKGRGGCPVQVGTQKPCGCSCHDGATEPRGLLLVKPIRRVVERVEDEPEPVVAPAIKEEPLAPQEAELTGVGVGEQIPLL